MPIDLADLPPLPDDAEGRHDWRWKLFEQLIREHLRTFNQIDTDEDGRALWAQVREAEHQLVNAKLAEMKRAETGRRVNAGKATAKAAYPEMEAMVERFGQLIDERPYRGGQRDAYEALHKEYSTVPRLDTLRRRLAKKR